MLISTIIIGSSKFLRYTVNELYNLLNTTSTVVYRLIFLGNDRKKFMIKAIEE